MKQPRILALFLTSLLLVQTPTRAANYKHFTVAIYAPISATEKMKDPQWLAQNWDRLASQVKIDKIYIETYRGRQFADEATLEPIKKFFQDRGIAVAGGMALDAGSINGQFQSPCYTDPKDRKMVQDATELTARHFDEIILDDFFFDTTKKESDIAAKGSKTWTEFRLQLMDEVAQDLLLKPAKAINPKVKITIKFPNWYEHFQGLGYDLEKEPKLFDAIYTGTETRDPVNTEQHLQAYESYQVMRYFENIKPGGNGGGWVDPYQFNTVDRYAEQLWNTAFAKPKEITLFNFLSLEQPLISGDRGIWHDQQTSFDWDKMLEGFKPTEQIKEPEISRAAGYALQTADAAIEKLGTPIGIKSYRPFHATGEDFLHNHLGMIGIPIDLRPEFPTDADMLLLTESAKFDPDIVAKIKGQLVAGKSVVITSGLLRALQHHGIEDICELEYTGHTALVTEFQGQGGRSLSPIRLSPGILIPQIRFLTNDAWMLVAGIANGNGYPLLLSDRYANGILYVLTIPENFNDLYAIPSEALSAIKRVIMRDFPVRLESPSQVALYAYNNNTFIAESYLPQAATVTISLAGENSKLRNITSGQEIPRQPKEPASTTRPNRARQFGPPRASFSIELKPHSFEVFAVEK